MGSSSIEVFDWHRIFIGDQPWSYLLEIVFRTLVMYVYGFILVRLIGKRAMREFTPFEYIIIIAMGSSMGDPMFMPDIPLLHCMVVLTVILGLNRIMHSITSKSGKTEDRLKGFTDWIICEGRIDLDVIRREDFTLKELRSQVRLKGIKNLGEVRFGFVEPNGDISIFKFSDFDMERPKGLNILAEVLERGEQALYKQGQVLQDKRDFSCTECGYTTHFRDTVLQACKYCKNAEWMESE
jgi:uncharacterized membrane protein YcaP (DUF421 family)